MPTKTFKVKCESISTYNFDKKKERNYSFSKGTDKSDQQIYFSISEIAGKDDAIKYEIDKEYIVTIE